MFKIVPWSNDIDLTEFYKQASKKGFINNSSQKMLIDAFNHEREKQIWILYYDNVAVGSVAAHSFDDIMGENSYRIAVRTCVLTSLLPEKYKTARGVNGIIYNQNITGQILIPTCINWAPKGSKLYITSNENETGTQKLVHRIFCPAMEKTGQMKRIKEVEYRGTMQTVWQLFPDKFFEYLNNPKK